MTIDHIGGGATPAAQPAGAASSIVLPEASQSVSGATSRSNPATPQRRLAPWLLLLLCLPPLGRLLTGRGVLLAHDDYTSDLLHSQLPYRAFLGRWIRRGEFPSWFPDVYSGVPLAAQLESGAFYPPNALLYTLLSPFTALDVSIVLHVLLGSGGTYLLARVLGAKPLPAALAGIAFGLSGFNVAHLKHRNMHESAAWLPWIFLAVEHRLAGKGRRFDVLLGLCVGAALLAGHPQILWLGLATVGLRLLVALRTTPRAAMVLGVSVVFGLGVGAVGLLPQMLFTPESTRTSGLGWEYAASLPYWLPDLATFLWPAANGLYENGTYYDHAPSTSLPWESYGFVGVGTLVLAALGAPRRRLLTFGTLLAALAMLGPATPVFRALWTVAPGLSLFRFPQRFVLLVDLGICLLAAGGLTWLVEKTRRPWIGPLAVAVVTAELWMAQSPRIPVDDSAHWGGDWSDLGDRVWVDEPYGFWMRAYEESRGFETGFERYREAGRIPVANRSSMLGARHVEGYTNMATRRTGAVWQRHSRELLHERRRPVEFRADGSLAPAFLAHLDRGAVRFAFSSRPSLGPGWVLRGTGASYAFERVDPFPRAYVASAWAAATDLAEASTWLMEEGPGTRSPVVEGLAARPGTAPLHSVPLSEDGPDRVVLDLAQAPGGLLVLADSSAPGWRAILDGVEVPIQPTNVWQRGVLITPKSRELVFEYEAPGLRAGLLISVLSLLAFMVWGLWPLRRGGLGARGRDVAVRLEER